MAQITIVGAGIGGIPMAYELREILGRKHQITLISNTDKFCFVPSNPWLAVGWRKREDIEIELQGPLRARGIELIVSPMRKLIPEENRIELGNGDSHSYDYLVIATGPELAFDEVPGLGPDGHTISVCTGDHAEHARLEWEKFVQEPGPIIVGAAQGASCFGPAYETAMIMETDLRRRKIRDKVPMTFVTSEPYIGHLGLGGVGDSKTLMESSFRKFHIKWICNAKVDRVEEGTMHVIEFDDLGNEKQRHALPFKMSMMLPAFRGIAPLRGVEGLTNPKGFVIVDKHQRNPTWRNIFSVGVCVAIPPVEQTPVPTGCPKTGYMIESMVTATAHNIGALLDGKEPDEEGTLNAICLADFGASGAAFVALPQIPPRNVSWFAQGKWVHYAKIAFEKYFLRKVRTGVSEPIYEKYVLKAIGVRKLKP